MSEMIPKNSKIIIKVVNSGKDLGCEFLGRPDDLEYMFLAGLTNFAMHSVKEEHIEEWAEEFAEQFVDAIKNRNNLKDHIKDMSEMEYRLNTIKDIDIE